MDVLDKIYYRFNQNFLMLKIFAFLSFLFFIIVLLVSPDNIGALGVSGLVWFCAWLSLGVYWLLFDCRRIIKIIKNDPSKIKIVRKSGIRGGGYQGRGPVLIFTLINGRKYYLATRPGDVRILLGELQEKNIAFHSNLDIFSFEGK